MGTDLTLLPPSLPIQSCPHSHGICTCTPQETFLAGQRAATFTPWLLASQAAPSPAAALSTPLGPGHCWGLGLLPPGPRPRVVLTLQFEKSGFFPDKASCLLLLESLFGGPRIQVCGMPFLTTSQTASLRQMGRFKVLQLSASRWGFLLFFFA